MFKQIVVGTDGSAGANDAVDKAIELAKLSGAALYIVYAYKTSSAGAFASAAEMGTIAADALVESTEAAQSLGQRICDEAVVRAEGVARVVGRCVPGDAAEALLLVAKESECDLVVVGNRGMTGKRRFVLGSVPNKLSHHCPSSLLIVDTTSARA
jgi:nucleotide-binding universal stress UspA family protein